MHSICYNGEIGEVQEWLNWPLSKSGMEQSIEGSNPSLSARYNFLDDVYYGACVRIA